LSLFIFHPIWTKCSSLWHMGEPLQIFRYFILERDLDGCPNFKCLLFFCLMVFNATFKNISVISWHSVLLVEETGRSGENHRPVASYWQTLSQNVVRHTLIEIRTHNIFACINFIRCWCGFFSQLIDYRAFGNLLNFLYRFWFQR
jgi:hypothetical protein